MVSLSPRIAAELPALIVHIRVRLFAIQRELAGAREVVLVLESGATVEEAWEALVALHPVLAPGRSAVRSAASSPPSNSLRRAFSM